MAPSPKPTPDTKIPLRILMLHGYTRSGPLFHSKTRALHKALTKSLPTYDFQLSYPTGPIRLDPADIPGYDNPSENGNNEELEPAFGWWRRKDLPHPSKPGETEIIYTGLQDGLARIAESIRDEGPFDGVIGFSQGACAAGMLASLLEPGRREIFIRAAHSGSETTEKFPPSFHNIQAPLKFAIIYSGFPAPGPRYASFYDPPIKTPTLHFLGTLDGVVEEGRSRALIESCEGAREVVHPGGHFLPSQRPWLDAAVGFVRECLKIDKNGGGRGQGEKKGKEEEGVEDMDVPF
ncbi:MAG: hypothetical protein Q9225_003724 [Loekoesia sp. 1 TL-2023]